MQLLGRGRLAAAEFDQTRQHRIHDALEQLAFDESRLERLTRSVRAPGTERAQPLQMLGSVTPVFAWTERRSNRESVWKDKSAKTTKSASVERRTETEFPEKPDLWEVGMRTGPAPSTF